MNLKKPYCIKCSKYRKLKNPNISNIFYKALVLWSNKKYNKRITNKTQNLFKVIFHF